nr:SpaH/EbpB family LPXTG-anchored major pilin [uncultured Blautia sp.]
MKLFKKIAAIMLSIMMVLGMASVVSAEGTMTSGTSVATGTITISNVAPGATYKIYRILDLESYSENNYAYKLREETSPSPWKVFIESQTNYVNINNGYVTWKVNQDVKEFAKLALAHATNNKVTPDGEHTVPADAQTASTNIVFSNLPLGYYLIDSGAGTLCLLDTTNPDINIEEKNGVPSVEKKVSSEQNGTYGQSNSANIGDKVYFQTTITAQLGAQNYVLHDKMDAGLTFGGTVTVKKGETEVAATNYTLTKSTDSSANFTDGCTFHIEFKKTFCDTLAKDDKIIVTYSATLNEKAVIAGEGNKNTTKLTYGDSSETTTSTTTTKTFELPVFKYTKEGTSDKALAGATFTLSKNANGTTPIGLVKTSEESATEDTYRVAKTDEANTVTEVTTPTSGKFTIQGLDADTYYLTETQQPAGYNKLKDPVQVVIDGNGNITIGTATTTTTEVKVENNTGSILPSTGGSGTTLIYILGAILVLGSSVVLITKKRMR